MFRYCWVTILMASFVLPTLANAQDAPPAQGAPKLKTKAVVQEKPDAGELEKKVGFLIGYNLMQGLKADGSMVSPESILAGLTAAFEGKEQGISPQEAQSIMSSYQLILQEQRVAKQKVEAESNEAVGKKYMADNAAKNPNVKKLPNGVQYEVLTAGTGEQPKAEDKVKVNYHGTFINGKVFDSTIKHPSGREPRPAEFSVSQVVPGFSAALQAMKVGSKWKIAIPGELAYGLRGAPRAGIGPNQMLLFEIELLEIVN